MGVQVRLSVRRSDKGYRTLKALPRNVVPLVYLDGELVKRCITVDSKTGYVLRAALDERGKLILNARCNGVVLEQLRGRVSIGWAKLERTAAVRGATI